MPTQGRLIATPTHDGRTLAAVALVFVLLAAGMTYPLVTNPTALGRIDADDARHGMWNVAWVAQAVVTAPGRLFDANIFYPNRSTLAYSEPNVVAGLIGAPAYWLTGNALLAYNTVLLVAFVVNGLGGYLLARYLTGSATAALFGGIAFAFCPFNFSRLAHLQLLLSAGLPLGLLAFHRFVDRPHPRAALLLGVVWAIQMLACGYYGIFLGLVLGVAAPFFALTRGAWRNPRYWGGLAFAAGLAALLILPFARPVLQLRQETGFTRTLDEARMFSARWNSYVTSTSRVHNVAFSAVPKDRKVLFPGFLPVALAGLALAGAMGNGARTETRGQRGNTGEQDGHARKWVAFYTLLAGLALWASFGPDAGLFGWLYSIFPFAAFLRAPARLGVVVALAIALVGAFSIRGLLRRPMVARVLLILLIVELCPAPLRLQQLEPIPRAYAMLRELPRGAVAEFPFFSERWDYPKHTLYMLYSTVHWQPLVNGYSDYIPPDFRALSAELDSAGPVEAADRLVERGVRYVVVHFHLYADLYGADKARRLAEQLRERRDLLRPLVYGPTTLYELVQPAEPVAPTPIASSMP